jgi:hypothetical protein
LFPTDILEAVDKLAGILSDGEGPLFLVMFFDGKMMFDRSSSRTVTRRNTETRSFLSSWLKAIGVCFLSVLSRHSDGLRTIRFGGTVEREEISCFDSSPRSVCSLAHASVRPLRNFSD